MCLFCGSACSEACSAWNTLIPMIEGRPVWRIKIGEKISPILSKSQDCIKRKCRSTSYSIREVDVRRLPGHPGGIPLLITCAHPGPPRCLGLPITGYY
ncbi:hypothetical protein SISNIDRAFT_225553 [Sistotremastrum niveocremeum HHB9708]|uniref:Uncharacterized protein n=1 Tax=Sistotremastrum niveocremeum HHB9708 TaxID=1314777 RepID=A0A164Q9T1_9AGAM|nr:hypothetical protein SISNIDRAFT_225553 [Sistotremastrum niveocremeum HHB9708]